MDTVLQKGSGAGKRKSLFVNQEDSAKQRKISHSGQHLNAKSSQSAVHSPKSTKPKTSPKKGALEDKGHDRPFIKTSSLFRNNPEIPEVLRSVKHFV